MLNALLAGYQATGESEEADLARMTRLAAAAGDPWSRSLPLHFTASALVVHPPTRRVLLRWHVKSGLWLQVGGHADPGESDPLDIALREAAEETGLPDLMPWPDASLRHVAVCHVRASGAEPEHEHADLRYLLATGSPEAIAAENAESPLRWLTLDQARALVGGNNLRHTLDRTESFFERGQGTLRWFDQQHSRGAHLMVGNRRGTRRARAALAGAAALLAVGVAACTGSPSSTGAAGQPSPTVTAVPGGTARVALPAHVTPDWIWPYIPQAHAGEYNTAGFETLMYRPLYLFGGNGPSVSVNYPLSTADAPAFTGGGTTVTITMKGWKWSDGEPVDASDVIFWLNMMKAEPAGYYGHVSGLLPDNLASYAAVGQNTVVLHLKTAVSSIWFTYDQLAEITPMPAAWDVTSVGAKAGSGGCAADSAADNWASCDAVFKFLSAQSKDTSTYATSPLWGVVDGPWKLSSFAAAASGPVASFVPNPAYSGSERPALSKVTYYAYPDAASEYTALKNGQLDFGYVPPQDLTPVSGSQLLPPTSPLGSNYTLSEAYPFGVQSLVINFSDPTLGPAFRQLYVRQALQELIDQNNMISSIDRGYGYPTSGAVPNQPSSPWVPPIQNATGSQAPYAFSIGSATTLLTSHGWKRAGGVLTCETPALCGPGVAAGTKLSMTLDFPSGDPAIAQEVALVKADAGQAGIRINPVARSRATIDTESATCTSGHRCPWDMRFADWNFDGPGFEPTGELLFATGAPSNAGSFSDPTENKLIGLTHTSNSLTVFQQYATYTAEQLPSLWMPTAYTVTATNAKLANVWSNPLAMLLPEYWSFTR